MPRRFLALRLHVLSFAAALLLPGFTSHDAELDRLAFPEAVSAEAPAAAEQAEVPEDRVEPPLAPAVPSRLHAPPIATAVPLPRAGDVLARARLDGTGHLVVQEDHRDRVLTVEPRLQEVLTRTLSDYRTPYAAVVVLEPSTGRVLAMAEHSEADPQMRGLPTKAIFPAASIFKLVTASALLDEGVAPEDEACFHGGKRRISDRLLEDSGADRRCLSLASALGQSANGVFAKLTHRHLTAAKLLEEARAFHFNRPIAFPVPTDVSLAAIPEDPLGLASAGAGFGDVYLSPLHGALLASVAANGGLWRTPVLFEDELGTAAPERVLSEDQARALTEMMEETVTHGTARRFFRHAGLHGAVGKTGSLADKAPFRDYSWFVGFAPKESPQVAVAAVIVNQMRWRIRASWLAGEAMRLALAERITAHR